MLPRVNLIRTDETDYLMFSTSDSISMTVYLNGSWALPLLKIAETFLAAVESPFVLDIGANLGAFAVPIAQKIAARGGVVFAYEPQRIVYYQLCGNIFLNRLQHVYAFNMALGDSVGEVSIPNIRYDNFNNIGAFSLDPENPTGVDYKAPNFTSPSSNPSVPLQTLDNIALPSPPSLIKLDVEGMELQVLKGAINTLRRHSFPPLMLESWSIDAHAARRIALETFLCDMGYQLFRVQDEVIAQHPNFPVQLEIRVTAEGGLQWGRVR